MGPLPRPSSAAFREFSFGVQSRALGLWSVADTRLSFSCSLRSSPVLPLRYNCGTRAMDGAGLFANLFERPEEPCPSEQALVEDEEEEEESTATVGILPSMISSTGSLLNGARRFLALRSGTAGPEQAGSEEHVSLAATAATDIPALPSRPTLDSAAGSARLCPGPGGGSAPAADRRASTRRSTV